MVAAAPAVTHAPVARLWPDSTIVCIGTGPSLTPEDVAFCRGRAHVIAVKDAIRLAPWADVLYSGEDRWWKHHGATLDFPGLRYTLHWECGEWAQVLQMGGFDGLCLQPHQLASGHHSGYQAVNLAVHLGALRIVLLGYDMEAGTNDQAHWFGAHPYKQRNPTCILRRHVDVYRSMRPTLEKLGIEVVNASRHTALTDFPRLPIAEALA